MAYSGMTIGLLGGTFNPPHVGHLHISQVALKRLDLDRLWWLVTLGNPLKTSNDAATFAKRLNDAENFAAHPRIDVTGFEASRGSAYTADMLAFLTSRYPMTRFIWIMGADNLVTFHHWQRWRDILKRVPVAIIDRPGYRYAARSARAAQYFDRSYVDESDASGLFRCQPPAWTFITAQLSDLSSSSLRAKAR